MANEAAPLLGLHRSTEKKIVQKLSGVRFFLEFSLVGMITIAMGMRLANSYYAVESSTPAPAPAASSATPNHWSAPLLLVWFVICSSVAMHALVFVILLVPPPPAPKVAPFAVWMSPFTLWGFLSQVFIFYVAVGKNGETWEWIFVAVMCCFNFIVIVFTLKNPLSVEKFLMLREMAAAAGGGQQNVRQP